MSTSCLVQDDIAAQQATLPSVRLSEVVAALSYALDITEGQPEGHAARSTLISMKLAELLDLPAEARSALYYGTLLKDAGCSSNSAKMCSLFQTDDRQVKHDIKTVDWVVRKKALRFALKHTARDKSILARAFGVLTLALKPNEGKKMIQTRCSRGADIARKFGFPEKTAETILALDEHWDGRGEPLGMKGEEIPLLGRIAGIAQTVEVYCAEFGVSDALDMAMERSGTWFDPDLVKALTSIRADEAFWEKVQQSDARASVSAVEPPDIHFSLDEDRLDRLAEGFADVVDAKSPWTCQHSRGVAAATVRILDVLNYEPDEIRYWRRAALLHDIGKLGVSNLILDKPGPLTDEEYHAMKQHTIHTARILGRVTPFEALADIAAAHHERLDGKGYHLGLVAEQLSTEARVLAVADVFDALSAKRPYRKEQFPLDRVFAIMDKDAGTHLCPDCINALKVSLYFTG